MIKAAAVAAALAAAVAPASALRLFNYAHTESPGSVFETNFNGVGGGDTSGTFEVTIPSPSGCASIGFDLDSDGTESIAVFGSLSEGQSATGAGYSGGLIASLVRAASRPGCVGFSDFTSFDSSDSIFGLSQKVTGIPAGKFARVTFVLSEGAAEGSGVSYTAADGVRSLTSSVEIVDSFGCDEADVPAQCLHARAAAPAARITSEATGGRITASSARKCLTVAVIADDGQDHQAECNYESVSDSDGETAVKRA